jgi:hypothetical protein
MSSASEWGVPDWLYPRNYPAPKGPNALVIWAWEFLRRNWKFRDFWTNKVEPFMRADGRIGRDQTGTRWPYHREMQESFGIMDPWRQSNQIPSFCDLMTTIVPAAAVAYEKLPEITATTRPFVQPSKSNLSKEVISGTCSYVFRGSRWGL